MYGIEASLVTTVVLGITLGFALLSTTLKINGTAGIKSNAWNIHWDDRSVNVTQGSVSATNPLVSTTTSTKDTVSIFEPIYNDGGDTIYLCDQIEDKKANNKDIEIK